MWPIFRYLGYLKINSHWVSVVRCTALAPDWWQRHQKGNHSVLAWPTCNVKVVLLLQTWGLLHGQDGKFSTGYLILESRFSQLNWSIFKRFEISIPANSVAILESRWYYRVYQSEMVETKWLWGIEGSNFFLKTGWWNTNVQTSWSH